MTFYFNYFIGDCDIFPYIVLGFRFVIEDDELILKERTLNHMEAEY